MKPIIEVTNISKCYKLGSLAPREGLRHLLQHKADAVKCFITGKRSSARINEDNVVDTEFWALSKVSFEVKQGEIVGVLGRNGAGKSTLLKILSRITEPTQGRAIIRGRVASLLEVGTGFHPELTGRENVFLNGTILGMKQSEIKQKFDEIVAFSEIQKFIDTPVKRYSSGMYVRLAFAVAAHLEPDLLLLDEVLAVGDTNFQKKCLGKVNDIVRSSGRTILIVSHNMASLTGLCTRGILLEKGELVYDGSINNAVHKYTANLGQSNELIWDNASQAPGSENVKLRAVRVRSNHQITTTVDIDKEFVLEMEFDNYCEGAYLNSGFHFCDAMGNYLMATPSFPSATLGYDGWFGKPYPKGRYRAHVVVPGFLFNEGHYLIRAVVARDVGYVEAQNQGQELALVIQETGAMRNEYTGPWPGVIRPKLAWTTQKIA